MQAGCTKSDNLGRPIAGIKLNLPGCVQGLSFVQGLFGSDQRNLLNNINNRSI